MELLNRTARLLLLALPVAFAGVAHAAGAAAVEPAKHIDAKLRPASAGQGNVLDFSVVDKLPPRYSGSDCSAIARKLKSFDVAKNEFETSTAYTARITALSSRKLDGAHTLTDLIGFVEAGSDIKSSYVADAGRLDVTAKWYRITQSIEDNKYPGIFVSEKSTGEQRVVMSNAFGASVKGTQEQRAVCALAFANLSNVNDALGAISTSIPMTPAEAKAAKQQLALMYIGTIAPPYVGTYDGTLEATMEDPRQISWHGDSVLLSLTDVWLFNRATGEVYKKMPVGRQ